MKSIFKYSSLHDCFCGDMKGLGDLLKREIVSLFFLTIEFLSFNFQDQYQQKFPKGRSIVG